ncbi:MAG TPA: iron-sulfur cluster carrier protein MrpORP [Syntrophorhabdaceae bacterium]|nr:iron-sulfur cluster carrier protein MrpORP [Syntrophorhabdaceae bacterium]
MTECGQTSQGDEMDDLMLQERLSRIGRTLMVLSGKGGVGKSTVAVNLALSLAARGLRVGLLDVDIHGPSIPKMLGLNGKKLGVTENEIIPIECYGKLHVVSMGLLIEHDDQPVVWRGPLKYNVIKQFLQNVMWGTLDYLVIDAPPGTGDEPLSIGQLIKERAGAVIVTTPQQVATIDVAKCVTFCNQLGLPVTGIIENMSGFFCPHCGKEVDIFMSGGGKELASRMGVPFLGTVPLDPDIVRSGDSGQPYVLSYSTTETAKRFDEIVDKITALYSSDNTESARSPATTGNNNNPAAKSPGDGKQGAMDSQGGTMKFAVPTNEGKLCMHFGHCEAFALIDTDTQGRVLNETYVTPPPHEPGLLPPWLAQRGVNCIIAGGMGSRAQQLFAQHGVKVITGAQEENPRMAVENYLKGTLVTGANTCDH